jgi:uncharacterized zinc-type alcohol dehydrogenase-like protein
VQIEITHCGVCHSDIHQARNEWGNSIYPMVPGHEIVGRVQKVGAKVSKVKVGDMVGVGCMVDSCRTCSSCGEGLEQFCESGFVGTYNSLERDKKTPTYGGYANGIVVDEAFVLTLAPGLDPAGSAPLLCAGITTYSPLKYWGVGPGKKVGIVGLGGLGHMGVKFARAFGAETVCFTTSQSKKEDALRLGAHKAVLSKDPAEMAAHTGTFDFILDTVSANHDVNAYLALLKRDGVMCMVGIPETAVPLMAVHLVMGRKKLTGSLIGGIKETQEMLDYCAKHKIHSDVEVIPVQSINQAYERMIKGDVKYRFVIDMKSLNVK